MNIIYKKNVYLIIIVYLLKLGCNVSKTHCNIKETPGTNGFKYYTNPI